LQQVKRMTCCLLASVLSFSISRSLGGNCQPQVAHQNKLPIMTRMGSVQWDADVMLNFSCRYHTSKDVPSSSR
jgi:hypothetical protein